MEVLLKVNRLRLAGLYVFCSEKAKHNPAAACPSPAWWMNWCLSKSQVIAPPQTHLKYLNGVEHEWLGHRVSKATTVKGHCGRKRSVTVILSLCWQSGFCLRDTSDVHKHVPTVQPTANKTVTVRVGDMLSCCKLASQCADTKRRIAWHYHFVFLMWEYSNRIIMLTVSGLCFWVKQCLIYTSCNHNLASFTVFRSCGRAKGWWTSLVMWWETTTWPEKRIPFFSFFLSRL